MRLRMTDSRERMLDALLQATGEKTKSKALDTAVSHYVTCAGDNSAEPHGAYERLMETAIEQGSLTPDQIAEILSTGDLPVNYERDWSINE